MKNSNIRFKLDFGKIFGYYFKSYEIIVCFFHFLIIFADFGVLFHDFEVLWPSAHQYLYTDVI
jgi:hypothetical protein